VDSELHPTPRHGFFLRSGSSLMTLFNIASSALVFFFLIMFRKIDFDGGHEGYLLTTAIAESEGFKVFEEYFSLYGSVLPWIHSLMVPFGRYELAVNLRILDSLMIACCFYLILNLYRFDFGKNSIRLSQLFIASTTWLTLTYFLYGQSQHPWSSTIALLFQLLIVSLLFALSQSPSKVSIFVLSIFIGILLTILPMTRLNVGLATLFSVYAILGLFYKTFPAFPLAIRLVVGTNLLSVVAVLSLYALIGNLPLMIEQSVMIPRRVFTSAWMLGPENWNTIPTLLSYLTSSLPFILATSALIVIFMSKPIGKRLRLKIHLPLILLSALLIFILMLQRQSANWFYERLIVFLLVFGLACAAFWLCYTGISFLSRKVRFQLAEKFPVVVVSAIGISGAVQVFPTHDPRHIWWGIPLVILAIPLSFLSFQNSNQSFVTMTLFSSIVLASSATIMLTSVSDKLSQDRVQIDFEAPFKGLQVSEMKYQLLKSDYFFLKQQIESGEKVYFQCGVGETHWHSSFDGNFHSANKWFVDLSFYPGWPKPNYQSSITRKYVICGDKDEQDLRAAKYGLTITNRSENLAIGLKNLGE
jgi:hypothetical protein